MENIINAKIKCKTDPSICSVLFRDKKNTWLENVKNPEPDPGIGKISVGFKHSPDTYSDFV